MALTQRDVTLLRLSVGICLGDWTLLRELRRAAPPGEPDRAWREAVLQAHLFAGFPRVVEAFGVLADAGGLGPPDPGEADYHPDNFDAGAELFGRIYGASADRVRTKLEQGHPILASWILGHTYGRVLSRPGLAPDRRELCAVVCLASLGQDRQLASHVRGGLHCGCTAGELRDCLEAIHDLIDERALRHAQRVVDRFAPLEDEG
ncbi:MAG: carboxymuconolactone decarboxylase family protein [Planctomycetota bacterium]